MAVTLKDVARAANVSATTVSRVVNNRATGISDSKRAEIQRLITDMGYHPNSIARGLVTRHTNALGIVLPNIVDPFFAEIARGAQDTAEKLGYITILINSDDDRAKERAAIQLLKDQCVAGILLYASGKLKKPEWNQLNQSSGGTPVVLLGHSLASAQTPTVFLDYRKGMAKMTDFLIKKGHSGIVYMAGMNTNPEHNDGVGGYLAALIRNDIKHNPNLICNGDFTLAGAKSATASLVGSGNEFTAVICENDLMAAGVLEALDERGIAVPSRISVTGFDDTFFSRLTSPKLTTLGFPKYEMGRTGVRLLLEIVETKQCVKPMVELSGAIIERGSTIDLKF